MRQEQIPKALGARHWLQLLNDRNHLPALPVADLGVEERLIRMNVFIHEGKQARPEVLHLGRVFEMHYCPLKSGARLPMKCATPSLKSSDCRLAIISFSAC